MTTPTHEDLQLYVMGCYDGDLPALEAYLAENAEARAFVAAEAGLELVLRDAAAAATFCPGCDDVVRGDRCDACGAVRRAGGYTIERVLVQNAHGRMYLACDVDGKQVALKELAFVQAPGVEALAAFEREARFLRALAHPAIPRFCASFQEGTGVHARCYLAQEFIAGQALDARLADHWYDEAEIRAIARQVLEVIAYLQALSPQIVHRDIKPANLVRRPDGSIALVDFGAAYDRGATIGSTAIGTFGYMPLEQMAGVVDATTDTYALGASLLHLLTRREPWRWLQTPAWDTVNVSAPLRDFLQRMVAAEPRDRFPSAAAALDALDRIERGEPPRVAAAVPAPRRRSRWWRKPALLVAAATVFGTGAVVGGYLTGDPPEPVPAVAPPVLAHATPPAPGLPAGKAIEMDFKDAPAADVMRFLGSACGLNVVMPGQIDFRVTVKLQQVPCDQALEVLLESRGLWYRYDPDGNLLRIDARKALDAEDEEAPERERIRAALGRSDALPDGPEIDLDFKDAPLHDVLRLLADAAKVNIVVPDDIDGKLTVRFAKVPWPRAVQAILAAHGLWYRYRDNGKVVRVAPRHQLDAEAEDELGRRSTDTGIPECNAYMMMVQRYMTCEKAPIGERRAARDRLEEVLGKWNAHVTTRASAADACRQGLQLVRVAATACPL